MTDEDPEVIARSLLDHEREVLLGKVDGWGAAVGAAYEALAGRGLTTPGLALTPLGYRVAAACRRLRL